MKMNVNGKTYELNDDYLDGSLLWALRDGAGLHGTKYGCGMGICGACAVRINGQISRACLVPVKDVLGKSVQTVEGLIDNNSGELHPVQQAFIKHQVPQCAWCMNGQIMTAVAFLEKNPDPEGSEIVNAMNANYCRCGCYDRIRTAVADVSASDKEQSDA